MEEEVTTPHGNVESGKAKTTMVKASQVKTNAETIIVKTKSTSDKPYKEKELEPKQTMYVSLRKLPRLATHVGMDLV